MKKKNKETIYENIKINQKRIKILNEVKNELSKDTNKNYLKKIEFNINNLYKNIERYEKQIEEYN